VKLIIALIAIAGIAFFSVINWRTAAKSVFFLVVFEGALRKWILPQASEIIYFLKDFVILGAYTGYFGFSRIKRNPALQNKNFLINLLVFLAAGWCLFQAFNPSLGSPIVGILGIKAYLLYIPLMWMLPALFPSEEELYKFLRSHLLLVIPTGVIGIIQFFSPPTSPINAYAPGIEQQVATFGFGSEAAVRITGTFSYLNSYAGYLIACFGLLLPLLSVKQSRWWKLVTIVELFLIVTNTVMTGSRTPVIAEIIILVGYLGALFLMNRGSLRGGTKQILLPATVIVTVAIFGFRSAFEQFERRLTSNTDLSRRIGENFLQPIDFFKYKQLDGYGTGATHPGAVPLRNLLRLPAGEYIPGYYEAEMGRVALELGPIGFTFWYGLRICIGLKLWSLFWKLKSPFLRQLAAIALLIHLVQLSGQMVFHHTFSVYYWFLSGFIFLLPQLEFINHWHQEQQLLQQNAQASYFSDSSY
jgi:hypothetical protein